MRELLLLTERGCQNVSSRKLADSLHIKPPQIRKDLSYFGDFGTPGVGYDTKKLLEHVRAILKLGSIHKAALVGLGNIGEPMCRRLSDSEYGGWAYDVNPAAMEDFEETGARSASSLK